MSKPSAWRVLAQVGAPLVGGSLFVLLTLVAVAPPSALQSALAPYTTPVTGAFLRQDWHLFAPGPVTTNDEVWYQVRYEDGGRVVDSAGASLSALLSGDAKKHWFAPSRMDRTAIVTGLAFRAVHDARTIPDPDEAMRQARIGALEAQAGGMAQRVVSGVATAQHPADPILAVRVWYTSTPVRSPWSASSAEPVTGSAPVLEDTGWLGYVPVQPP